MAPTEKQLAAAAERQKSVARILASKSPKRVVVAGPGTGKTHLFKKVLEGKRSALTLSFINALIDDLALDLYGASEVRTLHSYDDQALYDFKLASSDHIRACHGAKDTPYEAFSRPFCSRCPGVIVDATNDVVAKAKE